MRRAGTALLLAALAGAGLALRLWGVHQGYPDFYGHVDEVGVAASIWNFFRARTLLPTEFTYPAFYSYLVAFAAWLSGWLGLAPRAGSVLDSLVLVSFVDPAWIALVGRGLSAGLSTLSALVAYQLGREAFSRRTGVLAALFTSFAVVPTIQAHRALPDSTMAFLAALCFLFCWRIYRQGAWLDYVAAGVAAGLVVATKYNGAFVALGIPAAHLLRGRERPEPFRQVALDGRFWSAVVLSGAALFSGSPYLLLAREKYLAVATYQVSSLAFAVRETTPWWWIPRGLVQAELLVGVLMVVGAGWALYRRHPLDWIFLAAWVPSFLYIGSWTRENLHYLLHFYPLLAVAAARLADEGGRWSRRGFTVCLLAGLCVLPSVYRIVRHDRELARPDTRSVAGAWIEQHLPDGARLAMTWLPYCPRVALHQARQSIREFYGGNAAAQAEMDRRWKGRPAFHLVNLEVWRKQPAVPEAYRQQVDLADPETRRVFRREWLTPAHLRDRGVQYIVLPEAAYGRYLGGDPPAEGTAAHYHFVKNRQYFGALTAVHNPETELVASFPSGPGVRGAGIHILRLRP